MVLLVVFLLLLMPSMLLAFLAAGDFSARAANPGAPSPGTVFTGTASGVLVILVLLVLLVYLLPLGLLLFWFFYFVPTWVGGNLVDQLVFPLVLLCFCRRCCSCY